MHREHVVPEARLAEERTNVHHLYAGWLQSQHMVLTCCPSDTCLHPPCRAYHHAEAHHQRISRSLWASVTSIWAVLFVFGTTKVFIPGVAFLALSIIWIPPLTRWLNQRPAAYAQALYHRQWRTGVRRTLDCIHTLDYDSLQELKRLFVAITLAGDDRTWAANVRGVLAGCTLPPNALTETIHRIVEEVAS